MLRTVFCNDLFTQERWEKMRTTSVPARSNLNRGQKRKSYIKTQIMEITKGDFTYFIFYIQGDSITLGRNCILK